MLIRVTPITMTIPTGMSGTMDMTSGRRSKRILSLREIMMIIISPHPGTAPRTQGILRIPSIIGRRTLRTTIGTMIGMTVTVGTAGTTIGIPTGKQKLEEKERCIT